MTIIQSSNFVQCNHLDPHKKKDFLGTLLHHSTGNYISPKLSKPCKKIRHQMYYFVRLPKHFFLNFFFKSDTWGRGDLNPKCTRDANWATTYKAPKQSINNLTRCNVRIYNRPIKELNDFNSWSWKSLTNVRFQEQKPLSSEYST